MYETVVRNNIHDILRSTTVKVFRLLLAQYRNYLRSTSFIFCLTILLHNFRMKFPEACSTVCGNITLCSHQFCKEIEFYLQKAQRKSFDNGARCQEYVRTTLNSCNLFYLFKSKRTTMHPSIHAMISSSKYKRLSKQV